MAGHSGDVTGALNPLGSGAVVGRYAKQCDHYPSDDGVVVDFSNPTAIIAAGYRTMIHVRGERERAMKPKRLKKRLTAF